MFTEEGWPSTNQLFCHQAAWDMIKSMHEGLQGPCPAPLGEGGQPFAFTPVCECTTGDMYTLRTLSKWKFQPTAGVAWPLLGYADRFGTRKGFFNMAVVLPITSQDPRRALTTQRAVDWLRNKHSIVLTKHQQPQLGDPDGCQFTGFGLRGRFCLGEHGLVYIFTKAENEMLEDFFM